MDKAYFKAGKYRCKGHFWKCFLCFCNQTFSFTGESDDRRNNRYWSGSEAFYGSINFWICLSI